MKIIVWLLVGLSGLMSETASANDMKDIRLNDGSALRATVLSLNNGVYTLRSDSLGTLRIQASRIVSITHSAKESSGQISGSDVRANMEQVTLQLMNDPKILQRIMSLQDDPQFRSILKNPKVMGLISNGDYQNLSNHPKLKELMRHPAVQEIKKNMR